MSYITLKYPSTARTDHKEQLQLYHMAIQKHSFVPRVVFFPSYHQSDQSVFVSKCLVASDTALNSFSCIVPKPPLQTI